MTTLATPDPAAVRTERDDPIINNAVIVASTLTAFAFIFTAVDVIRLVSGTATAADIVQNPHTLFVLVPAWLGAASCVAFVNWRLSRSGSLS